MSKLIDEKWGILGFYGCVRTVNSKAVTRTKDVSTAALQTHISNLRRLVTGVRGSPNFSRQKLRFRPKLARSCELGGGDRVRIICA